MRENETKQVDGQDRRRWFSDEDHDLIVWETESGDISAFQVCYRIGGEERAITWNEKEGVGFAKVDAGDQTAEKNRTPVLIPTQEKPSNDALSRFRSVSSGIQSGLRKFILEKISSL